MHIVDVQGMSMIDYPGNIATVLFLGGCDFRCPNCQNPDLIQIRPETKRTSLEEVLAVLQERKNWIDGVAITGGEPLIHGDLPELCAAIKEKTGKLIKVDTNGNHPDLLERLIRDRLVDYIAMDVKSSPARYSEAAGKLVDIDRVMRSIEILKACPVDSEFRSTVVPGFVDEASIDDMGKLVAGARLWAFQQYQNRSVYDESFHNRKPYPPDKVRELAVRAGKYVQKVITRGI